MRHGTVEVQTPITSRARCLGMKKKKGAVIAAITTLRAALRCAVIDPTVAFSEPTTIAASLDVCLTFRCGAGSNKNRLVMVKVTSLVLVQAYF